MCSFRREINNQNIITLRNEYSSTCILTNYMYLYKSVYCFVKYSYNPFEPPPTNSSPNKGTLQRVQRLFFPFKSSPMFTNHSEIENNILPACSYISSNTITANMVFVRDVEIMPCYKHSNECPNIIKLVSKRDLYNKNR